MREFYSQPGYDALRRRMFDEIAKGAQSAEGSASDSRAI
jgi:hypothetical protein